MGGGEVAVAGGDLDFLDQRLAFGRGVEEPGVVLLEPAYPLVLQGVEQGVEPDAFQRDQIFGGGQQDALVAGIFDRPQLEIVDQHPFPLLAARVAQVEPRHRPARPGLAVGLVGALGLAGAAQPRQA